MKKVMALLVCFSLLLTMGLSGCGSSDDTAASSAGSTVAAASSSTPTPASETKPAEKVNLKISAWGIETDPNSVIIKEAVDLYNKTNTFNATATIEFTEQEQYKTKLAALMAGNEVPDVFNTWPAGFLKPFVKAGKIYSISDDLDKDAEWKGRYVGGMFAPLTFDGKIYGAPTTQTVVCLYYNTEIFNKLGLKVPTTYAELKAVCDTLNKNNITPFALGNKAPWVGAMMSEVIANRIGGSDPFNKIYDGTGTWEDPSYIEAGKIMDELVKMNAFPKGFNALDNDPAQEIFKQGKAGMLVMGSWAIQQLTNDQSPLKGKVDIAPFPAMDNGKGSVDNMLGQVDQSFAISANSQHKDAAVGFLKTMSDPTIQVKLGEAGNLIVTNAQIDPAKSNPLTQKVAELQKSMKELFLFYDVALGAVIGNEFNNTIQSITAGKSPEEAFKKLQQFTEQNKSN